MTLMLVKLVSQSSNGAGAK